MKYVTGFSAAVVLMATVAFFSPTTVTTFCEGIVTVNVIDKGLDLIEGLRE